jgi:Leucine-rich repeat (LRR) protein
LSGNHFTSIVSELFELKYLKKLSLSQNAMKELTNCPENIEILDLSYNEIRILNDHGHSLKNLQSLDLSFNLIKDFESFSGLTQLKCLYLKNNLLTSTDGVQRLKSIVELDLSGNSICLENVDCLALCQELAVISLQENKIVEQMKSLRSGFFINSSDQVFREFYEVQSGIFCRNSEKIALIKNSRFRNVMQSNNANRIPRFIHSPDWGGSKQGNDERVNALEGNEMKITVFNENDEEISSKKVPIAKLNLEKINHKVSYEKSSTKPETSLESLFEDLITFFQIEGKQEKEFSFSSEKYEQAVNFLKNREDERRKLIRKNESKIKKVEKLKNELEDQCLINSDLQRTYEDLQRQILIQNNLLKKLKNQNHSEVQVQTIEGDETSFIENSFESGISSYSQLPDLGFSIEFSKHMGGSDYLVHKDVKTYIEKLLHKISSLVKRKKALQGENRRLAGLVFKNK